MVKKLLIVFLLFVAFIIGGLGTNISIEYQPIEIEPNDAKMFHEAKLYLDTTAEFMSSNWWCSNVSHQGDSTFFFFEQGGLRDINKSILFGLYQNIQTTPLFGFPMIIAFYKGVFIGKIDMVD